MTVAVGARRLTGKQSRDRLWFAIHSWIGLKLSLLMVFILATGTIAVFSYEIDWLINPEMRASERVAAESTDWGAAFDTVRREYPEHRLLTLDRFQDNWFSLQLLAASPGGELVRIWLNPADGSLRGVTPFFNVQRLLRELHRHLMLPLNIGIPIVTFLAFPLLISLIAGFIVYKKFWKGWFRLPRFRRKRRIWHGDLHRLMGLWGSWFIALIAVTSIWYFVEQLGGRAPPFPAPEAEMVRQECSAARGLLRRRAQSCRASRPAGIARATNQPNTVSGQSCRAVDDSGRAVRHAGAAAGKQRRVRSAVTGDHRQFPGRGSWPAQPHRRSRRPAAFRLFWRHRQQNHLVHPWLDDDGPFGNRRGRQRVAIRAICAGGSDFQSVRSPGQARGQPQGQVVLGKLHKFHGRNC